MRILSILAFTSAQTILFENLFTSKFGRKLTLAVTALYCFWMNFCNEFLFTNGCVAIAQAVVTAAFLQIVFWGGLVQNYILCNFMGLVEGVVSIVFGGCAGAMYRWVTGTDAPLWISGEKLGPAGFFISLIYLGIVVLACGVFVPLFASGLCGWSKTVVRLLFGACLGLEAVGIWLTFSAEGADDLDAYIIAYGIIFTMILCAMVAAVVHMIRSAQRKWMENRLLEAKMREQHLQYEFVTSLQQEIREIRHDLINYLAASGGGGGGIPERKIEISR